MLVFSQNVDSYNLFIVLTVFFFFFLELLNLKSTRFGVHLTVFIIMNAFIIIYLYVCINSLLRN